MAPQELRAPLDDELGPDGNAPSGILGEVFSFEGSTAENYRVVHEEYYYPRTLLQRLRRIIVGSVVPRTDNVTIEIILVQPHVVAGHLPPPKIP